MGTRRCTQGILIAAALVVCAGSAWAGRQHARSGFFVGFGVGGGNLSWDWSEGGDESEWSGVANLRVGGALREDFVLGFESWAWAKEFDLVSSSNDVEATGTVTYGAAAFAATYFPGNMGFFLRGAVGLATGRVEVSLPSTGSFEITGESTDNGIALLAATGYEWRLTDKFALAPQVSVAFLGINGDAVGNALGVDATAQFNWYW